MTVEQIAALPSQPLGSDGLPCAEAATGMTLRDWFAGQALNGILANATSGLSFRSATGGNDDAAIKLMAATAVAFADQLSAILERKTDEE